MNDDELMHVMMCARTLRSTHPNLQPIHVTDDEEIGGKIGEDVEYNLH